MGYASFVSSVIEKDRAQRIASKNLTELFTRFSATLDGTNEYALNMQTIEDRMTEIFGHEGGIRFYNFFYHTMEGRGYINHEQEDFAIKVKILDGETAYIELYSLLQSKVKEWRYTEALSTEYPFLIR